MTECCTVTIIFQIVSFHTLSCTYLTENTRQQTTQVTMCTVATHTVNYSNIAHTL